MPKKPKADAKVEALTHVAAKRKNIPTAELETVVDPATKSPIRVAFERRNKDLDPQLVWRGKDEQDWSDLVVPAPPLYIQEKVHPKVLIDDLLRQSKARKKEAAPAAPDLFADFNGLPDKEAATEFYQHDAHWTNRLIVGDSLQVMASLAEREGLRGQVQCIYFDPPYGIKFNSNFQWSTTSRDVKDGSKDHISREPEQVRAFRDTWRDGIHSYLSYLRDRLTVARDLLSDSGSIFVQIGDENMHRVRAILDEVFGEENFASQITFRKKMMPLGSDVAEGVSDYLLWYAKSRDKIKSRSLFVEKLVQGESIWSNAVSPDGRRISLSRIQIDDHKNLPVGVSVYQAISLLPAQYRKNQDFEFPFEGKVWGPPKKNSWKTDRRGMDRLLLANRLHPSGVSLRYILRHDDYPVARVTNLWSDSSGATQQVYVVQTNVDV
jgi:adenine-specific DNA-methyltransferase